MSASEETTFLELPKYVATDKPTYLGDWNDAMDLIDGGVSAINLTVTGHTASISQAQQTATAAGTAATAAGTAAAAAQTTANNASASAAQAATAASQASSAAAAAQSTANAANTLATTLNTDSGWQRITDWSSTGDVNDGVFIRKIGRVVECQIISHNGFTLQTGVWNTVATWSVFPRDYRPVGKPAFFGLFPTSYDTAAQVRVDEDAATEVGAVGIRVYYAGSPEASTQSYFQAFGCWLV